MHEIGRQYRLEKPGAPRRYFQLRVQGCRTFTNWGVEGEQGTAHTMTWDSVAIAEKEADKKLRKKKTEGFREVDSAGYVDLYDPSAQVLDELSKLTLATGGPTYTFESHPAIPRCLVSKDNEFSYFLVPNADGTRALKMNVKNGGLEKGRVAAVLSAVVERIDEFLNVEVSAFIPLEGIAPFEGVAVLSAWAAMPERANPVIGRSVGLAFPAYRCEISSTDSVAKAELRAQAIPYADHTRDPVPVLLARYLVHGELGGRSKGGGKVFLSFKLRDLKSLLARFNQGTEGSWLEVMNFEGTVLRLVQSVDGATIEGIPAEHTDARAQVDAFLRGTEK